MYKLQSVSMYAMRKTADWIKMKQVLIIAYSYFLSFDLIFILFNECTIFMHLNLYQLIVWYIEDLDSLVGTSL